MGGGSVPAVLVVWRISVCSEHMLLLWSPVVVQGVTQVCYDDYMCGVVKWHEMTPYYTTSKQCYTSTGAIKSGYAWKGACTLHIHVFVWTGKHDTLS